MRGWNAIRSRATSIDRRNIGARARVLGRRAARLSPIRLNAKPGFLIVGAQKAGTSSLYSWLVEHPDVFPARAKELHFFDHASEPLKVNEYWVNFPSRTRLAVAGWRRRRRVVTGEATPIYLFDPRVPKMVKRHLPDVKIIILLRDPVERAISHYWMEFNRGSELLSLEEALNAEQDRLRPELQRLENGHPPGRAFRVSSYVARGQYAGQLERWLSEFQRDQVLILDFDHLTRVPSKTYDLALRFIGVAPTIATAPKFDAVRVGIKKPTSPDTLEWLRGQFTSSSAQVARLVSPAGDGDTIGRRD